MSYLLRLVLGALCITFAPIAVKSISLDPTVVAFYRCFGAAIFLLMVSFFTLKKELFRAFDLLIHHRSYRLFVLAAGVFFALDLLVWHKSIHFIGAGFATVLGNTQVFYIAIISALIHGLKLGKRFIFSLLVAFAGLCFMFYEMPTWVQPENYVVGVIFGLLTGLCYASYVQSLNQIQGIKNVVPVSISLGIVLLVSSFFLLIYAWNFENLVIPSRVSDWVWLLVLVFLAQVIGWVLISQSIGKLPVHLVSLVLLLQPALATLIGSYLFSENLVLMQVFGCALTLSGIYAGSQSLRRKYK